MKVWKYLAAVAALAVVLTACGGTSNKSNGSTGQSGKANGGGGTFTMAVAGDPGSLNPLNNTSTASNWLFRFLYDPLVNRSKDGSPSPGLASKWDFDGSTAVFTIRDDVTCSDGSKVTPSVIAKNFAYLHDPSKPSMSIGAVIPDRNFSFSADDAANTFTLKLDKPFSLLIYELSFLPIVCGPAADNPESLTTTSSGSGPYVLTNASVNSSYTMTKRAGYTWGLDGGTTADVPDKVVWQVVSDESTAANMLTTGQLNAAVINGPDRTRVQSANATTDLTVSGDVVMLFNQSKGRPAADAAVRRALIQAIDRDQVASTVTQGLLPKAGTSITAATPQVCDDTAAASSIPALNPDGAKAALAAAGASSMSITLGYSTATPGAAAAAELIATEWKAIGVSVKISPMTQADYQTRVFTSGDYDVMISQFSNPFPSTVVGLLDGPPPPTGTNAANINNTAYNAAVATALATPGADGCVAWVNASKALFDDATMVPLADWPT
ncbi:MAG: ABC transporter substrate-binding protein, partial [Actinomycetia bacterium]|nr:ABC transporter substrate-binding protein [Actinomycetes bacterium]